jgi:hypothetical protein
MPFKSLRQARFFFAAEARGELPKGTAKHWADETKKRRGGFKSLPEKVKKSTALSDLLKTARTDPFVLPSLPQSLSRVLDLSHEDPVPPAHLLAAMPTQTSAFFGGSRPDLPTRALLSDLLSQGMNPQPNAPQESDPYLESLEADESESDVLSATAVLKDAKAHTLPQSVQNFISLISQELKQI